MVHTPNINTPEAGAGGPLWKLGQLVLHSECKASLGNRVRPCLKISEGERGKDGGTG